MPTSYSVRTWFRQPVRASRDFVGVLMVVSSNVARDYGHERGLGTNREYVLNNADGRSAYP